jgi:hypothetical protein
MLASHELDLARRLATREVRIVGGQVHPIAAAGPGSVPSATSSAEAAATSSAAAAALAAQAKARA